MTNLVGGNIMTKQTTDKYSKLLLREGKIEKEISQRKDVKDISIHLIKRNPNQPRIAFDEDALEDLTKSIETIGVIEPLIVRPKGEYFELVVGERRLRAAQRANLSTVPCVIRELTDTEAFVLTLSYSVHREDLTPVEEARSYTYMLENKIATSMRDIAKRLGISHTRVNQKMNLLKLPDEIQERVATRVATNQGRITEGHARHLLKVPDKETQLKLFNQIVKNDLSTRETERRVKKILERPGKILKPTTFTIETDKATLKWKEGEGYTITIKQKENLISALKGLIQKAKEHQL